MPARINKGYKEFNKTTHLFHVNVKFTHKNSNPKVWNFLKNQIDKEFDGFTEVAEAIMGMSDVELDMLSKS